MSETSEAAAPRPSDPFWAATRERRLVLQWCPDCEQVVQFPRAFCPGCLRDQLDWREATGRGSIYAFSVARKAAPRPRSFKDAGDYVFALSALEEGGRMMSNVVDCNPAEVSVGMNVELCWKQREDGTALPQFRPGDTRG